MATRTTVRDAATVAEAEARAEAEAAGYGLPLVLRVRPVLELSEDEFFELCVLNRDIQIERNAEGELLIMPPAGADAGDREAEVTRQLGNWAKEDGTGRVFSPSTGFRLPNRAVRAADAAWIPRSRLEQFPADARRKFLPICPDFVIELRSPTDRLRTLQAKMEEYIEHGARLGWLIDPIVGRVHIYRPDAPVEILDRPARLSGEPVLPGFVLDLREIW